MKPHILQEGMQFTKVFQRFARKPATKYVYINYCFAGKLGVLIAAIQQNNYRISSLKLHRMSSTEAEQFLAAYKGVWDDYPVIEFLNPFSYVI